MLIYLLIVLVETTDGLFRIFSGFKKFVRYGQHRERYETKSARKNRFTLLFDLHTRKGLDGQLDMPDNKKFIKAAWHLSLPV